MSAIDVHSVTKIYRSGVGRARVREMMPPPFDRGVARMFPNWWGRDTFKALADVSISVEQGSSVALVGHNGAGKTTLLRVIAGVTDPAAGRVQVNGRIAALIDALVGFHPELTGRENVFLLGSMNGFKRKAMASRMERVLDFAEIHELADTPVKRYSAGMMARLGFAVIASLDPAILLVDEVLAVGDANFQRKCIDWLDEFRNGGGTLLFVSHNLGLVRNMTERAVWLDHGRVVADGATPDILSSYAGAMEKRESGHQMQSKRSAAKEIMGRGQLRWGSGGARVEEALIEEPEEDHGPVEVTICYDAEGLDEGLFCVGFVDEAGHELGAATSPPIRLGSAGEVKCRIDRLPLHTGVYFPVVAILSPDGQVRDHWKLERAIVVNGDTEALRTTFGPLAIHSRWSDSSESPAAAIQEAQ